MILTPTFSIYAYENGDHEGQCHLCEFRTYSPAGANPLGAPYEYCRRNLEKHGIEVHEHSPYYRRLVASYV